MHKHIPTLMLVLALAFALAAPSGTAASAAESGQSGMSGMQMGGGQRGGMQMGGMQGDMAKMHEKMMADMKAEQAKLDDLAAKMNAATGDAKMAAVADLLTEIVRDHGAMGEHMAMMHEHMMKMGK